MNKVLLMGRLTKDPEMRYTSGNNTAVVSFTLAVNRRFAKQGEQRQADFINCQAWDKIAEFISKYFIKGSQLAAVGRIQTRSYDNSEGKKVHITEVVIEEAYFAGEKKGTENKPSQDSDGGFYPLEDSDELPF